MRHLLIALLLVSAGATYGQFNPAPPQQPPSPQQIIQRWDRNGDGKISRDEAPERMRTHWDRIDINHDGFVTLQELEARNARVRQHHGRNQTPMRMDTAENPTTVAAAIPGTHAYVNAAAKGGIHNGKSWANAFASLQEALNARAAEIWVAEGTYTPGSNRTNTFQLHPGEAVYGGFIGDETRLDQRDWKHNKTILDGKGVYHVVTGANKAILDGFTITGGNGLGARPPSSQDSGYGAPGDTQPQIHTTPDRVLQAPEPGTGAGMLNFQAAPTVRNCIFEDNKALKGGAVYNMTSTTFPPRPEENSPAPTFINCIFRHNTARARGGAVSNDLGTSPTFFDCVFENNTTPAKGGGMYDDFGCSPTLVNCLFSGNSARSAGGMGNDGGSCPVLYFCTFTKNHAIDYGAPLYQGTGPANDPSLINCVITNNTCDWGDPGIYNWHDCTPLIKNGADSGYRAGRFSEDQLSGILDQLRQYRAQPAGPELTAPAPEEILSSSRIVYVDASSQNSGNGKSWKTAYPSLINALADAGRDGAAVHIAAGTYKLGSNRSDSFILQPGIRVFGGYRDGKRDPAKYPTVLDGNGDFHVVTGANGARLDGITITDGRADGTGYDGQGGGLIAYRRSPQNRPNSGTVTGFSMTLNNCVFKDNYAHEGGAVYNYDRSKPIFTDCHFIGNQAENGGAVLDRVGVKSTFTKCVFSNNHAQWRGGAAYFDYGSRPKMEACSFQHNSTGGHGGAVFSVSRASQLENTVVTLLSCRFEQNTAKGDGGAVALCDSSLGTIRDCSFDGNHAGRHDNNVFTDNSSSYWTRAVTSTEPQNQQDPTRFEREGGFSRNQNHRRRPTAAQTQFKPTADFSVIIIGSGSPRYNPNRSGPSALIQYHGKYVLVDMGNGTQARLHELGLPLSDISALLFTHHHLDHDEEFMPILVNRRMRGGPLEIIGPPGTSELTSFAENFYKPDLSYRMSRTGRTIDQASPTTVKEVNGGETFYLDGMKVTTMRVNHTIETVGYRFDADGQSIVISGDLTYTKNFSAFAHDADVLVMDSGGSIVRKGGKPRIHGRHNNAHATLEEVCEMAQGSHAKKLVLTHIGAPSVDEAATVKAVNTSFTGKVIVAHDLLEVAPGK